MKTYGININWGRNVTFGSKNNPINSFELDTSKGKLQVIEYTAKDFANDKKLTNLSDFFIQGFIYNTKDPSLLKYQEKEHTPMYSNLLSNIKKYYLHMIERDDGNMTTLVALNKHKRIAGAVVSEALQVEELGLYDPKTCYVDSVAVAKEYRRNNIAKRLIEAATKTPNNQFTDAFCASDNMAVAFELKNGYKIMDYNDSTVKFIIDKLNSLRGDFPDYITYMDKKLISGTESWYERVAKLLKK